MPSPLNPTLHGRLREEFGRVTISHAGIAAQFRHAPGILDGRLKFQLSEAGEYYKINCPYCGDTRGRLWINHLWGVPDEVTGGKNLFLSICYNENCLSVIGRAGDLYDRVYGFRNVGSRGQTRQITILQGDVEEQILREVGLPGVTLRLDRVPENDQVCTYLRNRGLDPVMLGKTFDVSYCLDANSNYHMAYGRIVIPVFMRKMLVGWQCRYVGDVDWKLRGIPKYYNLPNMPRRLMLYNFDTAREYPFCVVTEGPLDVWSVGEPAVAAFGKHLSAQQVRLLCENWEGGAIIILLDGDAWEDTEKLAERFRQEQFKGTVIPIRLPPDTDPGGLARSFLWECIETECQRVGVDLLTLFRSDTHANPDELRISYRAPRPNNATGRNMGPQQPVPSYTFDSPGDATSRS